MVVTYDWLDAVHAAIQPWRPCATPLCILEIRELRYCASR
jgi:hypothetical protein